MAALELATRPDYFPAEPRAKYFPLLDSIRGLAAVMVLIFHTKVLFGVNWKESYLAVDIFFVLSGVVIANAYEDSIGSSISLKRFAVIRLARLYPLYFVSIIIALSYAIADHLMPHRLIGSLALVASGLLFLPTPGGPSAFKLNPPSWSLFFELLINAVYATLLRWLSEKVIVIIMAVSALLIILFSTRHPLDAGWTWSSLHFGFVRVAYSFFAGVLILRLYKKNAKALNARSGNAFVPSLAVLGSIFAILAFVPPPRWSGPYGDAAILVAFPLIIRAALPIKVSATFGRVCGFMGVLSYSIYVLHEPLRNIILSEANGAIGKRLQAPLSGLVFIAVLVLFGFALDKYYDIPIRRFLTRRQSAR